MNILDGETREMMKDIYNGLFMRNGQFSSTKFFSVVAYSIASYLVLKMGVNITENTFLIYLGVVGGHATASKFLDLKFNNK